MTWRCRLPHYRRLRLVYVGLFLSKCWHPDFLPVKIQKALETQYLVGQEMEKTRLAKETGEHISGQSQPPPYPEGQIATAFTAALYPSLHTEEETHTEKAETPNEGPPTAVDNTRAALDRLGATTQEVQSDLQRRIDQLRNPTVSTTPKGPVTSTPYGGPGAQPPYFNPTPPSSGDWMSPPPGALATPFSVPKYDAQ